MKIHVIGVGKMGLPMARHLLAAGHVVTVEDPSTARMALAREAGLGSADDLARADLIVSSLPHDRALLAVSERVATHAARGAAWIDTSRRLTEGIIRKAAAAKMPSVGIRSATSRPPPTLTATTMASPSMDSDSSHNRGICCRVFW